MFSKTCDVRGPILVIGAFLAAPVCPSLAASLPPDMISPKSNGGLCLTVNGADPGIAPTMIMDSCRGTAQQMWTHDSVSGQWRSGLTDGLNNAYCLAAESTAPGWPLHLRLCSDSRALSLEPNPTLANSWRIVGTPNVIDWGVFGFPATASQNGFDYQLFSWLQPDLDVVNGSGCGITYPFLATDTATYNRESSCDHVAKIQPPYANANAARDPGVWPGTVVGGTPVSRSFAFNLQFKNSSYMRMSAAPGNWMSTGLYAPAGQVVTVNVSGATDAELADVYVQLGVHTDVLTPTSGNVTEQGGKIFRYPNVTNRVRLHPGDNLVRSPYGGIIEIGSNTSVPKTVTVAVSNAVAMPRFVLGTTSEADWLAQQALPGPWAEFESDLAVLYVNTDAIRTIPGSGIRTLSFADATGVAQFYRAIVAYENDLAGVGDVYPSPNDTPQGKHRFVLDLQIVAGTAHSGFPMMWWSNLPLGSAPLASPIDTFQRSTDLGWGIFHELGHNNQMSAWSDVYGTESTNNIFSLYLQEQMFGTSRMVNEGQYSLTIARLTDPTITDKWNSGDGDTPFWTKVIFLDQLRLGFPSVNWDYYRLAYRRYRAMTGADYDAINTDTLRYDTFMKIMCDITNTNLTPHFNAYTVPVSQAAKDYCAGKPNSLTRQIWLTNNEQPLWYHQGSGSGGFLREWWNGVSGSSVSDLTSNAGYPASPTGQETLATALEGRQNFGSNYGERLRAYLTPPVTGTYTFWLSTDNAAQLALSTDADPAHATTILSVTSSGNRAFDAQAMSVQRSAEIQLQAGQKYYIEVLHKTATGSDSVSVAWNIPATAGFPGEVRKLLAPQFLSPFVVDLGLTETLAAGQSSRVPPGSDVSYQVTVTNNGSTSVKNVQVTDTLPAGFALSPSDTNGWVKGYRYVRLQADSDWSNSDTTSVAELGLIDGGGAPIAKTGWTASAGSESRNDAPDGGPASYAIDGNTTTYWATEWSPPAPWPHTLTIDTGSPRTLTGFTYMGRSGNGHVKEYRFFVSEDGTNWTQVTSGTLADDTAQQTVNFTTPAPAKVFNTLAGPIAAGGASNLGLVLRSGAAEGSFINAASISAAQEVSNSRVYDTNSSNNGGAASVVVTTLPGAVSGLRIFANGRTLQWSQEPIGTAYDVVRGNLGLLRASHGDFTTSLLACAANDSPTTQADSPDTPSGGAGFYYLVRAVRGAQSGTYDETGAGQAGPRDAKIAASSVACP